MASRSATARWQPGPLRCEVDSDGFRILVDEPLAAGGTGTDPEPTHLLLASVASCFALALVYSAVRSNVALDGVQVEVEGHYEGYRFDAIHLSVEVNGPTADEVAQLITAAQRVCYVTNTLRAGASITVTTR